MKIMYFCLHNLCLGIYINCYEIVRVSDVTNNGDVCDKLSIVLQIGCNPVGAAEDKSLDTI
jgi:hypothetical protein